MMDKTDAPGSCSGGEQHEFRRSPWQVAKQIAAESVGASAECHCFADDGLIEAWLEAEI